MSEVQPLFNFDYDDRMPRFDSARWGYGPPPGTAAIAIACLLLGAASGGLLAVRDLLIARTPDVVGSGSARSERALPQARAPEVTEVERAYETVRTVYARDGLPGLARDGAACFAALERAPDYRRLDYCLAFDSFAGGVSRLVGPGPAEAATYFNEATVRHIQATDAVGASRPEANARLRLVSRLATSVANARGATAPLVVLPPAPPEPDVLEAPPPAVVEETPYRVLGPQEAPPAAVETPSATEAPPAVEPAAPPAAPAG